ncbi:MAG: gliding motility-associated C-terminal domain-containing protein, partial [Bacteroidales bacterium]|nr:gliding motility-associated C-terminal domain-containing protein [Bacteroidales bacterium]
FDRRELWIYDRTGRLIFHVLNPETEADCWSPNDTHSPDGTYFYRFVARSLSHSFDRKGVIEVLR